MSDQASRKPSNLDEQLLSGKVNLWGIILIILYEFIITLLFGYILFAFWPTEISATAATAQPTPVSFFMNTYLISSEVRMLVLIVIIGALGAQVRCFRSLYWYIGNRELVWSWVGMYLMLPFVGAILGLVFYLVIRAGFFSASATIEDSNPIGFIALAGLAGMFSEQAVLKLKDVAETLLTKPPSGKDTAT
jgi:hypothetical protein